MRACAMQAARSFSLRSSSIVRGFVQKETENEDDGNVALPGVFCADLRKSKTSREDARQRNEAGQP